MKTKLISPLLALSFATLSSAAPAFGEGEDTKKKPPFADDNAAAVEKKPEVQKKPSIRTWTVNRNQYSFTLSFEPGVPDPNEMTEILISANRIPKTADPRFGTQVPLHEARILAEIQSPSGEALGRYLVHPMPLARGRYGLHFTGSQPGIYSMKLRAKTKEGTEVEADLKFPVGVWPLPAELAGHGDTSNAQGARRVITSAGSK